MNRILLDTNAYVAFKQGEASVLEILQHADLIGMSAIVLGELTAGFAAGSKQKANLNELHLFLDTPRIAVFPVDEVTATYYARVYANLRLKGKPIPTNDLWIAATALQQGCKLCSFDVHFKAVENLVIATSINDFLL